MTKDELIKRLDIINRKYSHDTEVAHVKADEALIEYINDEEIKNAYDAIGKWYA